MTPKALLLAIRALQNHIDESCAHLEQGQEGALHALRVNLRRLRSMIIPVARKKPFRALGSTGGALARQTNPARELEVLIRELDSRGAVDTAPFRQRQTDAYTDILQGGELPEFRITLFEFLAITRRKDLPNRRELKRRIHARLDEWREEILEAMASPGSAPLPETNRHALRITIKRLRYTLEALDMRAPSSLRGALKTAQDALGDWHDRLNWIQWASHEPALQALVPVWQAEQQQFERTSDIALEALRPLLLPWLPSQHVTKATRKKKS